MIDYMLLVTVLVLAVVVTLPTRRISIQGGGIKNILFALWSIILVWVGSLSLLWWIFSCLRRQSLGFLVVCVHLVRFIHRAWNEFSLPSESRIWVSWTDWLHTAQQDYGHWPSLLNSWTIANISVYIKFARCPIQNLYLCLCSWRLAMAMVRGVAGGQLKGCKQDKK